jgi:hypothetical protein
LLWVKSIINGDGLMNLVKCIVEGRESFLILKLEAFREEESHFCYAKGECWGIIQE